MIKLILITGISFFIQLLGYVLPTNKSKGVNLFIGGVISLFTMAGAYFILEKYRLESYIILVLIISTVLPFLYSLLFYNNEEKEEEVEDGKIQPFTLRGERGFVLKMFDPFVHFLVLAGTKGGKTASVGKPLLREYFRNKFAIFIYDAKDGDFTKTAFYFKELLDYPFKFYYISFTDLSRTYRFNPWKPSIMESELDLVQYAFDLLESYKTANSKDGGASGAGKEFYDAGVGVLKGVCVRFYKDYPQYCTIPHIYLYLVQNVSNVEKITNFLLKDEQSKAYATSFIGASETPKLQASYITSLTTYISNLSANKNICYVLSGDDFDFNLIDPENPKTVAISNAYKIMDDLSPVIGSLFTISSRGLSIENKVPLAFVVDEGTTFKIKGFENMISLLREYKLSVLFITQSLSKISMIYGKEALESLLSNFGNLFLGRTKDTVSQNKFVKLFQQIKKKEENFNRGSNSKGGSNRGTSYKMVDKDKYKPAYFSTLKSGQFVGIGTDANKNEFETRFQLHEQPDDIELPIVKKVTQQMIDDNYQKIIDVVKSLV